MYKITIKNAGIENYNIAQYCVKADSYREAGELALEISGKQHVIMVVSLSA